MRICVLLVMLLVINGCTPYEVGKVSSQRQHLYDYNNNEEYCSEHKDMCVGNVSWN
jgi:hypothetical protein